MDQAAKPGFAEPAWVPADSTLRIAPTAGSNRVSDVSRAIAYMESQGGPDVTLANGTEPFTGPLLP